MIFRSFLILTLSLALTSCSMMARKKEPAPAPPDIKEELSKIEVALASGSLKKAKVRLKRFAQTHSNTDVADDAYMILGRLYYKNGEYNEAYDSFMSVVNSEFFSPQEADALLWSSRSLNKLGRFDEALSLTNRALKVRGLSKDVKFELYKVRFSLLNQTGDRLDALSSLIYLYENSSTDRQRESYRIKAMDIVDSRLNDKEIEVVANNKSYGFVRGIALFRVATAHFEQRDYWRAKDYFEEVIELLPESDLAQDSRQYIDQIEARRKVSPYTVGAVLPLSGRHSKVAYKTLRGLQLGLGISEKGGSRFRLAIIDSKGNPDTARRAVERLVVEDHVVAIVGSLLSRTSTAVAAKSDELGVPSIALSQKSGLTEVGDHVFRNALTSEAQMRHLVRTAMDIHGLKKFAILYPNDPYGIEYTNLFWDEVLARGGEVTAAQTYTPKETDFSSHVQRLVGTYYLEDRRSEYRTRFKDWLEKQKNVGRRISPPIDLLPPSIDFDAIFIPDSTRAVGQIAPMLTYHDIKGVHLLGTNLWNNRDFIKRGQGFANQSLFVDSFLASDKRFKQSRFYREYRKAFGLKPGLFEAQAYDAGLLLREIILSGNRSRGGVTQELAQVKGFTGSLGALKMSARRELSRPLVSLTVDEGKISPAPLKPFKTEEPAEPKKTN